MRRNAPIAVKSLARNIHTAQISGGPSQTTADCRGCQANAQWQHGSASRGTWQQMRNYLVCYMLHGTAGSQAVRAHFSKMLVCLV